MSEPRLRQAVRGLLIDPEDRILMVKLLYPPTNWVGWILPGGGIEEGEDTVAALRRELLEETGATPQNSCIGPVLCHRRHISSFMTGFDGQFETIHLVPCRSFEIAPGLSASELRAEGVVDSRWWRLDELENTTEILRPENLIQLIETTLEHGAPDTPPQYEIRT